MPAFILPFAIETLRLTAWLFLLAIIFVPLERLFAERPQRILRRQFFVDLGYYFVNSLVTAALLVSITATLRRVAPDTLAAASADMPIWLRLPVILAVSEFGTYWGHRLSHGIPLLWRFHAIHHSAGEVDWLSNTRAHPVDMIFTRLCGLLPLFLSGLIQSGPGSDGILAPLAMIVTTVWGFFIHANLKWRFGWLEALIATPAFHRRHHSDDISRACNFASTLPVYDWIFGTARAAGDTGTVTFGIAAPMPADLAGQLLSPFDRPGRVVAG